jgi:hypothetical protein
VAVTLRSHWAPNTSNGVLRLWAVSEELTGVVYPLA